MKTFDNLVIGGGFAGLYAALRLVQSGQSVVIVDQAPEVGGLLRSECLKDASGRNFWFDLGTHFLLIPGDEVIGADLLSVVNSDDWLWFDKSLNEGHVYGDRLIRDTGCLDLTPTVNYRDYVADFLLAPGEGQDAATLEQRWNLDFGARLQREHLAAVCRKLTGRAPAELSAQAFDVFAPHRFKLVDGQVSAALKASPSVDRRLAYANRRMGKSNIIKGYPRGGLGVGLFIDGLVQTLRASGVEIVTSAKLLGFEWVDGKPTKTTLGTADGPRVIAFDRIVTALAPAPLARILEVEVPAAPFAARNLELLHFVADGPLAVNDLHWITVYEPSMRSFRITLYDNVAAADPARPRITVEVASDRGEDTAPLAGLIAAELARMGLIEDASRVSLLGTTTLPVALPILLPGWKPALEAQSQAIRAAVPNLLALGPANGKPFGQLGLLADIASRIARPSRTMEPSAGEARSERSRGSRTAFN